MAGGWRQFLLPCVAVLTACVSSAQRTSLSDLAQEAEFPAWAKPAVAQPEPGKPWQVMGDSRESTAEMRRSVRRLRYVVTHYARSSDYPLYLMRLSQHLVDLEMNRLSYQHLVTLRDLPADTLHNSALYSFPTLDSVKDEGRFLLARLLARNGLRDEALAELGRRPIRHGYDAVRAAEIHAMLGRSKEARLTLKHARGDGHPEARHSNAFIRLRAMLIARVLGEDDLALSIAQPILSKGERWQKRAQWRASWRIMKQVSVNIARGRVPAGAALSAGTVEGECRGFIGPIVVSVRAKPGAIEKVSVIQQHEDRPWSALDAIPYRIGKRGDLQVDAVSHATVTTCAIMAAVDDALLSSVER